MNDEYAIDINIDELTDLKDIQSNYIERDNGNFWVATHNNNVVSCIGIMSLNGYDYELRRMYTKIEFRGLGITQTLMSVLFEWCTMHNIHSIYLEANENWRAANHIYEKFGFSTISVKNLPKEFNVVKVATHFYHKTIAQQGDAPEPAST